MDRRRSGPTPCATTREGPACAGTTSPAGEQLARRRPRWRYARPPSGARGRRGGRRSRPPPRHPRLGAAARRAASRAAPRTESRMEARRPGWCAAQG
eukprot:scaffold7607_cov104-Isochrysis_galbana.AAC.5